MADAKANFTTIEGYLNEVIAARDGEDTLLEQIDSLQSLIAALTASNGPLAEYIAGRFVFDNGLTPTTTSTVLTVTLDDSYAFFCAMAF
jgi:hypothetical protein